MKQKPLNFALYTTNKNKMVLKYIAAFGFERYTLIETVIYIYIFHKFQLPNVPFKILPSIQKRYTQSVQINNTSKPNFRFCPVSSINTPQLIPCTTQKINPHTSEYATQKNIIIKATLKKLRFHLRFFNSSNTKTISFYTCHQICIYI